MADGAARAGADLHRGGGIHRLRPLEHHARGLLSLQQCLHRLHQPPAGAAYETVGLRRDGAPRGACSAAARRGTVSTGRGTPVAGRMESLQGAVHDAPYLRRVGHRPRCCAAAGRQRGAEVRLHRRVGTPADVGVWLQPQRQPACDAEGTSRGVPARPGVLRNLQPETGRHARARVLAEE